ncbi:MAG: hypothetical protein ACI30J_09720 [Paludibacteraceae bacterium]
MKRKYIGFTFVMAVCCYYVAIMRLIGTSSDSAIAWEIPSANSPSSLQGNIGRMCATAPAYSNATYTEDIPWIQTSTHSRFRSTSSVLPSAPVKSASIDRHTTDIALAYPTPLQSIGLGYAASDARLHSYGTQGGSGTAGGRSHRTSSKGTGNFASVSGIASLSPLRGNNSYHGFTTVASELNGTTIADDTDVQDVPSRRNVSPGVPPFAPVGDAVLPLLLLMAIHIGRKSRGSR